MGSDSSQPGTGQAHSVAGGGDNTVHVSVPITTAAFFFQLMPATAADQYVAPKPYVLKINGAVVGNGTTGSDGSISLPMVDGATTTVEVGGTTYSVSASRSPDTEATTTSKIEWLPGGTTGLGIGLHNLAFNDLSWLRSVTSRPYWGPLLPQSGIILERSVDQLPRDLTSKLVSYVATRPAASQAGWVSETGFPIQFQPDPASPLRRAFTADEMQSIEGLVRRYNVNPDSLGASELQLLREAIRIHVGGATPNTPLTSYSAPGTKVPWTNRRAYRVRVKVESTAALDISAPNAFNQGSEALTNAAEAEFSVVGDQSGRIVSVEAVGTKVGPLAKFAVEHAETIRWGGRLVIVGGVGYSAYKIANAAPEDRPRVIGEEAGGQVGGLGGAVLATSACVIGLGFTTGGPGAFACGLIGGVGGGVMGSAVGGAAWVQTHKWYNSVGDWFNNAIWQAIHHSAEQQGDILPPSLSGAGDDILGAPIFP